MATSTFERKIEITDSEALIRLLKITSDETPRKPITLAPNFYEERVKIEKILKQCPRRSK